MQESVPPDLARDLLYALPAAPAVETIPLLESLGRVLAEELTAGLPIPPFDRSPWDGYALRGADTAAASLKTPVTLKVAAASAADLPPGYAARVFTGSPIPSGADATVKYELTEWTESEVRLFAPLKPGTDVIYAGDDVPAGTLLARRGDVINPPLMGLIASVGRAEIQAFKPPRAAIINTGPELVEPGRPLPPLKVYNSGLFALTGYLREQGVDAFSYGLLPDDPGLIAERIRAGLEISDLVVTTGGASVGEVDFALSAARRLGAEILFWKVKIKPGGAVVTSTWGGKLILSLSGNPGGAIMFLLRVALPYIRKLCGRADGFPEPVEVYLKSPFNKVSERSRLLRGRLELSGGRAYFVECGAQGGGDISSFHGADMLAEIPEGSPPLPAGALVKAYRI